LANLFRLRKSLHELQHRTRRAQIKVTTLLANTTLFLQIDYDPFVVLSEFLLDACPKIE